MPSVTRAGAPCSESRTRCSYRTGVSMMPHRLDHREPFPEAPTPCSRTDVGDQVAAETVSRLSRSAARLRNPLSGDLHGISRQMRVARWCRPAHKPHKVNETVTVYCRFHPFAGTRATTLENRSHRGEPIVVVADCDGHRYHLPLWMTAPEAAQWGLCDRPRLSHSALSELRDLIAVWSAQPAPPATGDRDEISKATEAAEDADVRAAAPGQRAALPSIARVSVRNAAN